jgi:hypothetical protein
MIEMTNKRYLALLPLGAVLALVTAPTVAQAAPVWYKCEHFTAATHNRKDNQCSETTTTGNFELKRLPFTGANTQIITSGKLTLTASNGIVITCKVIDAGNVNNPTGEGAGKDNIEVFVNYECTSAECATVTVTAEKLPYETELEEVEESKVKLIRDKIKGIQITVNCAGTALTLTGELTPKIVNATSAISPTVAEFTGATGDGSLSGSGVTATVEGKDKIVGFEALEGIQVGAGPERVWFVDGKQLSKSAHTEAIHGPATLAGFKLSSEKLKATAACNTVALATPVSEISETREMQATFEFGGCSVKTAGHCELEGTKIATANLEGILQGGVAVAFKVKKLKEPVFTFKLKAEGAEACGEVGTWEVKGTIEAQLREPEKERPGKTLVFEAPGSALEMANPKKVEGPAVFEAEVQGVELTSKESWSAKPAE